MARIGLSQSEFSKLAGCSRRTVQVAIRDGRLTPLPDGSLDPASLDSGWRRWRLLRQQGTKPLRPRLDMAKVQIAVDAFDDLTGIEQDAFCVTTWLRPDGPEDPSTDEDWDNHVRYLNGELPT